MANELALTERKELTLGGTENPAIYAAAVRAAKEIEVAYVMALNRPRNIQQTRQDLLSACQRPFFAAQVEYAKPVGGGKIAKSPSIRFAEEAIRTYRNIHIVKSVIYEDLVIRKIQVRVVDLESNIAYEDECTLQKTVERKNPEGREVITSRTNSKGETTYLVAATEDEMLTKTNAQVSKMIRVLALRLIPSDITEEALIVAKKILKDTDAIDPKSATKKVFDSFQSIGITAEMLAEYVGSNKDIFTEDELQDLRAIYTAIVNKETTWKEVIGDTKEKINESDTTTNTKKSPAWKKAIKNIAGTKTDEEPLKLSPLQEYVAGIPSEFSGEAIKELKITKPINELTDEECELIKQKANEVANRIDEKAKAVK